jgi:hypothetical protein
LRKICRGDRPRSPAVSHKHGVSSNGRMISAPTVSPPGDCTRRAQANRPYVCALMQGRARPTPTEARLKEKTALALVLYDIIFNATGLGNCRGDPCGIGRLPACGRGLRPPTGVASACCPAGVLQAFPPVRAERPLERLDVLGGKIAALLWKTFCVPVPRVAVCGRTLRGVALLLASRYRPCRSCAVTARTATAPLHCRFIHICADNKRITIASPPAALGACYKEPINKTHLTSRTTRYARLLSLKRSDCTTPVLSRQGLRCACRAAARCYASLTACGWRGGV